MELWQRLVFSIVHRRAGIRVYLDAPSLSYGDLAGMSTCAGVTVRRRRLVVIVCGMRGMGVAICTDWKPRFLRAHALAVV